MSEPFVSIIVPVYNVENYLKQCVESLINQTLENIEIILVNDGSIDNSGIICNDFAKEDDRIIVIHQKNEGLSSARNSGTKIAKAKYITYIDADDWFEPQTIETAYKLAEEKQVDVVFWQMIKEYYNKSIKVSGAFGKNILFEGDDLKNLHRRICGPIDKEMNKPQLIDSFISAWGKLYKLAVIKQHNLKFVDTKILGSEDIFFNFQYFGVIDKAYYLNEHLIHYRKDNLASLTKTHGSTLFPRFLKLFKYLENEIRKNKLDEKYNTALNNRVCISMMNIGLSETSPRNSKGAFKQIKSLNSYLSEPRYSRSFKHLHFKYFPLHWKLFFLCCKLKFSLGVFLLLKGMRLFIIK
ncbi:MAG: glycosyltransferase [Ignavibacteriae bacterium]|nr:glycosyltransferase [Ignavibacteriota bacterium]